MDLNIALFNRYGIDIEQAKQSSVGAQSATDPYLLALLEFLRATDYVVIKRYEYLLDGVTLTVGEEELAERKKVRQIINITYSDFQK